MYRLQHLQSRSIADVPKCRCRVGGLRDPSQRKSGRVLSQYFSLSHG